MKSMLYKYLFGVSVKHRYKIWQISMRIVFLYEFFNKVIYIEQLYLFELNLKLVCYLRKALYKLKQVL